MKHLGNNKLFKESNLKSFIFWCLNKFGIGVTSADNLAELKSDRFELATLRDFLKFKQNLDATEIPFELKQTAIREFSNSKAQLHQDLFALIYSNFKTNGFFVEFGATDGIGLSNSFILEESYNWEGILAEPAKKWHHTLQINRNCLIDTNCVWSVSGKILEFNETKSGELSTIDIFSHQDMHAKKRKRGKKYKVMTISLEDLLLKYNAPNFVDYLSVDTEGSEFDILKDFNFEKYLFGFISCEHNFTQSRELVFKLLSSKGYARVHEEISQFDDWYVHSSLIETE